MIYLKQSTAYTWKAGPFLDDTDGKTAETALSIAQADIRLSKIGGDIAQSHNSAGATHDEIGYYDVPLDTTDTNTAGALLVAIHKSGALPVWETFIVLPANVYDSLFSTDKLEVDVSQWKGSTAQDMTGDAFARLGAPAGASVSADILAIKNYVDDLETRLTATRAGYLDTINDLVNGGRLDLLIDAIKAKTDNLPASPADDTSIDSQLATIAGYLDTEIAAIKAKTDNLPAAPADDTSIDSQLATIAGYLDTEIAAILAAVDTEIAAIKAKTDSLTFTAAGILDSNVVNWKGSAAQAMTGDAFARLGAPAGASVSADIAAAKAVVDAVKVVTDRLNGGLELNGGLYRWTAAALALAPSGSGLSDILEIAQKLDTALELDGAVYKLTENALENAPTGSGMDEMAAILAKVETMLAAGEGTDWKWTAESLIDSPVGTGGFTAADRVKLYALVTQIAENRAASAFSYSDESTEPVHQLRRMTGDTDSSDILMTDGELNLIWDQNQVYTEEKKNLDLCAAIACEEIASRFARMAVKAIGDLQGQMLQQKSANYRSQAKLFRARLDGGEDEVSTGGPGFKTTAVGGRSRFRKGPGRG